MSIPKNEVLEIIKAIEELTKNLKEGTKEERRAKARKFLVDAGIYTESGKLTDPLKELNQRGSLYRNDD
jgi:hypothetical protein